MSYNLTVLDAAYGRPEVVRRIRAYREQHGGTLAGAVEALTRELHEQAPITDGQVRVTIAVLRAYVDGMLSLDGDILDDLEDAIEDAYEACYGDSPPMAVSA